MAREHRILWAPVAAQDLEDIVDYIASQDGPDAAQKVYEKLRARTRTLQTHPKRCRIVPELRSIGVMEYRELIIAPYRLFFRIEGDKVNVLGILDGRRDLEETLIRRAMR